MENTVLRPALPLLLLALAAPAALAKPQTITGPATRVSLLELYTSEGCSSCPPAEDWLGSLTDDDRLWKQVVPVAFHVDYWDYLGWRDPFDARAYTLRQQEIASHAGGSTIYTPQFVLDGKDWLNWFNHRPLSLDDDAAKAGVLSMTADGRDVKLRFLPATTDDMQLTAYVTLLAFGVEVPVGAGENNGVTLRHDFLVVSYARVTLQRTPTGYVGEATLAAPVTKAGRYALAGWVSLSGNPEPLQAAGGWISEAR